MRSPTCRDPIPLQPESAGFSFELAPTDSVFTPASLLDLGPIHPDSQQLLDDGFQLLLHEHGQSQSWPSDASVAIPDGPTCSREALSPHDSPEFNQLMPTQNLDHCRRNLPGVLSLDGGPDLASRLIGNWFDEVCPAWSAFDSDMNMNRKLAADLWFSSASVFNSLQSMSASFLSARLPQMRQPALSLLKTATLCIQAEVDSIGSKPQLDCMPTGLLFSLFCLGTTICWLDANRLGAPFLKEAKGLLRRASQQYPATDEDKAGVLGFFQKSLVYWEMLISVVEDADLRSDIDGMILFGHTQQTSDNTGKTSTDILPHPWTGISSMTSHLFARSMRLCRNYRRRITNPTGRAISLSTAMQEIQDAQGLEKQLLELEFSSISEMNGTGDWRTPWLHLAHVAESYQLASLLQLYVTFPDLVSIRLPRESGYSRGDVPWDRWIIPLTLRLTRVLEQIPPDSGSRVIQPLLYICASTGLRFSLSVSTDHDPCDMVFGATGVSSGPNDNSLDILGYINQIDASGITGPTSNSVPSVALDIGIARNFIMKRLKLLETTLQPKPIIVAEELVKAVWDAYDNEAPGCTSVHWLDVMEKKGLQSLFG